MKKNSKIWFIVVVILAFLLVSGGIYFFFFKGEKGFDKKNPTQNQEQKDKEESSKKKKTNRDIVLERCYESLCVSILTVKTDDSIQFKLENKGSIASTEGFFAIKLDNGIEKKFYAPIIQPGQSVEVVINYEEEEVENIKDYQIFPTTVE